MDEEVSWGSAVYREGYVMEGNDVFWLDKGPGVIVVRDTMKDWHDRFEEMHKEMLNKQKEIEDGNYKGGVDGEEVSFGVILPKRRSSGREAAFKFLSGSHGCQGLCGEPAK